MKNCYESSIRQFQVQKIKLVKRETHAHFDRRAQVMVTSFLVAIPANGQQ